MKIRNKTSKQLHLALGIASFRTQGWRLMHYLRHASFLTVAFATMLLVARADAQVPCTLSGNTCIIKFFNASYYNPITQWMDIHLGITGYTVDTFETLPFIPGLTIELSGFQNRSPPVLWTMLPALYPGIICAGYQAWDGTHTATNEPTNNILNCNDSSGSAQFTTFNAPTGTISFGLGLSNFQSLCTTTTNCNYPPVTNHGLWINGVYAGAIETLAAGANCVTPPSTCWTPGLGLNAYLRIDTTPGYSISTVTIENLTPPPYPPDFLQFDHLAVAECVPPPNTTMVAWYPFDEQPPILESANLATANTGYQYNGPLGVTPGKVGGAAKFNGINQYVESYSSIVTNFGFPRTALFCSVNNGQNREGDYSTCQGNFSIDTWVNISNAPSGIMAIVDKREGSPPTMQGYNFYVVGGSLGLQLADGEPPSPGYTDYTSPVSLPYNGQWHHIAVTVVRGGPNRAITWYVDGAAIGTSTPTRVGSLVNDSPLRIGTRTADPPLSGWFMGSLDELEIYNRALTAGEVQAIYGAGPGGKCKPISYLPAESGSR